MLRKRVRDYVKSYMSDCGKFRVSLIDSSDCLKTFINKFNLNPHSSTHDFKAINLMGQSMSASMLLSSLLKGEERIKLELFISNSNIINLSNNTSNYSSNNNNNNNNNINNNNNLINYVHVESIQVGEIRGFVKFDQGDDEQNDIFSVSKILMNHSKPVTSSLPLILDNSEFSNLNNTFEEFFEKSEQIPTVTSLVCKQEFGLDPISFGIIIQKLPSSEDLSEELNYYKSKLNEMIKKINNRQDVHDNLFYNFIINENLETVRYKPIDFYCRCSKDLILNALNTINVNELIEMRNEIVNGEKIHFESTCDYCNNNYFIDENDLSLLITKK
ncbi:predicted protein [Naegleria gruberi]|uniref:Predicted protein n=1 Tax=Naegleria gruberi TaxID=5762 RepID=D2VV46_NAEGR|nr:uncharacterized protein NAEGRDRAFT_72888 [Naegleria gruberi]EFC39243.1 predicted protein [Naegleria gruberi]|eukprot:XP_002671987.1 predicted protein [Naegleria gruberi strain NEG-M]